MPSIADQHVVVLGGTSGFGFATAKAALAEGAKVTIASRSAEKLRGALVRLGNVANGECVDVTVKPMLERFFAGLETVPPYEGAPPAITYSGLWGAEDVKLADSDGSRWLYCAVAKKP